MLTDFGIARAVSGYVAATGFMMTIGTPAYISPEQAQGRTLDGRSDLYSLGITLYRMVTGEVPFRSKDWFELARMHVEERPEPPRNRHPELSKRLERIVLRLLAKHPDDRYPSAAALLEDLADIADRSRPTSDIPVPEGYLRDSKTAHQRRRRRRSGKGGGRCGSRRRSRHLRRPARIEGPLHRSGCSPPASTRSAIRCIAVG